MEIGDKEWREKIMNVERQKIKNKLRKKKERK